ncbi:hypothetical protein CWI38_0195p0030 [Hamiltosporidium tvaerminnensis]|uniref:Uncharacterized protein n=2 Tax=Hamiltosporidium TaxID=1176354 RepID=A0A4Q9L4H3_9MICR|nr:hypothetical protein CWI36_1128p0010 [Hamiltosporidium magnivora]TBU19817.1 hypothetical protein CWI38_0195p0030 [Hamiltosporidium tvaerminnensis]
MKFWRNKFFKICSIIVLIVFIFVAIICITGYRKANALVENFQTDVNDCSETDLFKKLLGVLKNYKICVFIKTVYGPNTAFYIPVFRNHNEVKKYLFKAITNKDEKKFKGVKSSADIYLCGSVDLENFSVPEDIDSITKIGLWFKNKQVQKTIEEIRDHIRNVLNETKENQLNIVYLNIANDETVEVYNVSASYKTDQIYFLSFKSFEFSLETKSTEELLDYMTFFILKVTGGRFKDTNEK